MTSLPTDSQNPPETPAFNWAALARLKLRHLILYRNVCESAGLSRAAELSHMTQPAASKLVSEMEEMFGVQLFVRGKFGTEPTAYGEALLRYVRTVLADLAEAKNHMEAMTRGESGTLRLGVIPFIPAEIVAMACASLRDAHPKVVVSLTEGSSTMLVELLRRGELDMTLARVVSQSAVEDLTVKPIYNEPFSAVARPGNTAVTGNPMPWADLSCQSWVLPSAGSLSRMAVDLAFVKQGRIGPRAVVECQSLEQIRQQVKFSNLFGVLPTADALQLERQGLLKVVRKDMAAHVSPISLLWRRDREMAVEETRFIEILSGAASGYVKAREVQPAP